MAKNITKSKEWKRRQKKIKELRRTDDTILASQEKLFRRVVERIGVDGGKYILDTNPDREKLSEVIIDFARPMLDAALTDEQTRSAISLAMAIWNTSLLPEEQQLPFLKQFTPSGQEPSPDRDQFLSYFLARKKALFGEVRRMVMDYEVLDTPKGFQLNVVSQQLKT
jgi:hypothetical protein